VKKLLTIKQMQDWIRGKYFKRDSSRGILKTFLWLVEEIGELAEAIRSEDREKIIEEIADVLAWTASVANLLDIDLEKAFKLKYLGEEI
jgi:NTP pyrophosphatase (non-canonical NTP hydrolase)